MQFDEMKDEGNISDGCFKDHFSKNEMGLVSEKACSSSSIEVQGKSCELALLIKPSNYNVKILFSINILWNIILQFYLIPSVAGDIEENIADMEQGISYDLLGNNLEGKLMAIFVI